MTSRERVLASINHEEPDYVPLDLGGTPSSGISAIAYNNLKKEMGISGGHTRIYDVVPVSYTHLGLQQSCRIKYGIISQNSKIMIKKFHILCM